MARTIRVHHDQAGDLDLFQNQAGRWKQAWTSPRPSGPGVAAYEALIAKLLMVP